MGQSGPVDHPRPPSASFFQQEEVEGRAAEGETRLAPVGRQLRHEAPAPSGADLSGSDGKRPRRSQSSESTEATQDGERLGTDELAADLSCPGASLIDHENFLPGRREKRRRRRPGGSPSDDEHLHARGEGIRDLGARSAGAHGIGRSRRKRRSGKHFSARPRFQPTSTRRDRASASVRERRTERGASFRVTRPEKNARESR